MLWSLVSLFVKLVTPRQLPSHFTRDKNKKWVKKGCAVHSWSQCPPPSNRADWNTTGFKMPIWMRRSAWWKFTINSLQGNELRGSIGGDFHVRACRFQAAMRLHNYTKVVSANHPKGYALKTFNFEIHTVKAQFLTTAEMNVCSSRDELTQSIDTLLMVYTEFNYDWKKIQH